MTEDLKSDYSPRQRAVGELYYVFIVAACIITLGGLVWSIADYWMPTGKLGVFLELNLGYQIAIIAGFLAGLFFLLIFFFGLFRKGSILVLRFLFKTRNIEERYRNRLDVKIAAGGLLISIIAVVVGLIYAIINDLLIGPGSTAPFSNLLSTFTSGNWTLFIGIATFAFIAISLFMVYFWKNGYYVILKIMGTLEK
ncbi:MAG: hypothetical protein EU552_00655 [Promethearchaeota archaeon]|nr:MAG: hypothetical protein EU552_00655 [Candidatus Lokiarchaeota archaeon]